MRRIIATYSVVAGSLWLAACSGAASPQGPSVAPPPGLGASRCGNDLQQRPWCDTRLDAAQRTALLLDAMTLSQKIALMAGDNPTSVINGMPATGVVDGSENFQPFTRRGLGVVLEHKDVVFHAMAWSNVHTASSLLQRHEIAQQHWREAGGQRSLGLVDCSYRSSNERRGIAKRR